MADLDFIRQEMQRLRSEPNKDDIDFLDGEINLFIERSTDRLDDIRGEMGVLLEESSGLDAVISEAVLLQQQLYSLLENVDGD